MHLGRLVSLKSKLPINVHVPPSMQINVHVPPSMQINVHVPPSMQINVHVPPSMQINVQVNLIITLSLGSIETDCVISEPCYNEVIYYGHIAK